MTRLRLLGLTAAMLAITVGGVLATRAASAGGGGCHEPVTDGRGTNVDLKGNCMITTILRVDAGDTVTFTNRDEVQHTVTEAGVRSGDGTSFGSFEPLSQGQTLTHLFATNGVYVYYCMLHPGMVGAVVVGDGSGPGSASGDGAAPAGVTRRTASDIAALQAPVTAATSSGRGIDSIWLAALGLGAVAIAGGAAFATTGRLRLRRFRPIGR